MRHLTRFRPSPALVVALLALCVALGSGAFAAVRSTPSQSGLIRACYAKKGGDLRLVKGRAKCSKRERKLSFAKRGPRGARGVQGEQGDPGPQGATGPSNAFATRPTSSVALELTPTTVATLALPPGSYVISAKLWVDAPGTMTFLAGADCSLTAGADSDSSRLQAASTGGANLQVPIALALDHVAAAPETVTLSCSRVGAGPVTPTNPVITAIRVGSIN